MGKNEQMYHSQVSLLVFLWIRIIVFQGGKLPLKWMSPEAIENYLFSAASDVWGLDCKNLI